MLCKVFEHSRDFRDMQKDINQWLTSNKGIEIVKICQQGGTYSSEDNSSMLDIVTTIFYRDKF